jgi:hypothetical protein
MKYLTEVDLPVLKQIVSDSLNSKPKDYFNWVNDPTIEQSKEEIISTYKRKLNSVYSERFLLTMNYIFSAVQKGHKVAFIQKTTEVGIPFDASGWIIVSINTYPFFHISPEDLSLATLNGLGWINVIKDDSPEAEEHAWKHTNKFDEYQMMMDWLLTPIKRDSEH